MAYEYKFIPAAAEIGFGSAGSQKNGYTELFAETVRQQFYNSTDWWTVEEETYVGSAVYEDTDIRVAHVINAETGLKLGDDWKTVLFPDIEHDVSLGKHYIFNDNTWLTVNTEVIKNLSATCTIIRCNNTLRWIDELTGAFYEEPCGIGYVKESRNYITQGSPFPTPGGFLHIQAQFNERTSKINENQRFLFGNSEHWTCYKVIGTGLNDFRNDKTYDMNSAKILTIDLIADFVNEELDDVELGIADVNTNVYSVTLNSDSIEGAPLDTIQLVANVVYNGNTVTRTMEWQTSASDIATVDDSGLVTFISSGSCVVTTNILNNDASASCDVTVTDTPLANSYIGVSPDTNYILEGLTETYSVTRYENDVAQVDTFTISINSNSVPSTSFVFTVIDGNTFSIKNILRSVDSYLTITIVSGTYTKSTNIYLRGAW